MEDIDVQRVNTSLDTVIIAELPGGLFETIGDVQDWLTAFDPDIAPGRPFTLERTLAFFTTYIAEVRDALAREPTARVSSGPWSEADRDGRERHLSAISLRIADRLVIQLKLIDENQLYHQAVFQKAREYSLNYERLVKERDKKEALLHTIVHDLAGPLSAITGSLKLLAAGSGARASSAELVQTALEHCQAEQALINSTLEAFAAELGSFDAEAIDLATAPDARACVSRVVAEVTPVFMNHQIDLRWARDRDEQAPLPVVADEDALRRVIANLLENALRHSPPRTCTQVEVVEKGDRVRIAVSDQGHGVPEVLKATLFDRFTGGRKSGGRIGLGLYFCRITVERWGGRIGYEAADAASGTSPGTRIWFELQRPGAGARPVAPGS